MNIYVISVGKIKEKYLRQGIDEYIKRLQSYAKTTILEVKEEQAPETLSEAEQVQVKEKEGQRILQHIKPGMVSIALERTGEMWTSEQLAAELDRFVTYGNSDIGFIIGGSLGLSRDVLQRADQTLSFSKMTFPHQLMRFILLEQIYRACRINAGHPYHK